MPSTHRERREASRSPSRKSHSGQGEDDSYSRRRHSRDDDRKRSHRSRRRDDDRERRKGSSRQSDDYEPRSRRGREDDNKESRRYKETKHSAREERRRRSVSESSEELLDLAELGVEVISTDDYFLKAGEFRYWLKVERGKYLDQLTSSDAHKYFRRFVRRWNDGALPRDCYTPHESTASRASANTSYKWSFTDRSRFNSQELAAARASVDRLTHGKGEPEGAETEAAAEASSEDEVGPKLSLSPGPHVGPSLPTVSERQIGRETQAEAARMDRSAARKAERKSVLEKVEDLVPREKGREGKMAEKKASNAENRKFADKDATAGFEVDEATLFGDDSGFAAALRARDAAEGRRTDRRAESAAEMRAAHEERVAERREKESATMDMFKALAKQRFGGS